MGDDTKDDERYRAQKRTRKKKAEDAKDAKKTVVPVCNEVLDEIWIHVNEAERSGRVTFLTKSGREIRRFLVYTHFVEGEWTIQFDEEDGQLIDPLEAEYVDPELVDRVQKMHDDGITLISWLHKDQKSKMSPVVSCLLESAKGRKILVRVTYFRGSPASGQSTDSPSHPLTDDYLDKLKDPDLAKVFLLMLEHFAGIYVDSGIAAGGISKKEYEHLLEKESKNPDLPVKVIARVVTQAYHEFLNTGDDSLDGNNLIAMTETLLYQRKRKNVLALRNQLEIAQGLLRKPDGSVEGDSGIKKRGESVMLLYNRDGEAVRAYVGYMDKHYRTVRLEEIPTIEVPVGESAEADLLRIMAQTFKYPAQEIAVSLASYADFYKYINEEISRRYDGEIEEKIVAMLPMAIGFFVVHAVLGAMAKRGNPYAAAVVVAAKTLGWIMDIDMGIATSKKMAEAGRHFGQMERLHRRQPKEREKQKLTRLSRHHLAKGTEALIEAMSELIAMGVFIVGAKAGQKVAGGIAKHVKKKRDDARLEFHLNEDGKVEKVRSTKEGQKEIKVETDKNAGGVGGKHTDKVIDLFPRDEQGPFMGRRQKTHSPKPPKSRTPVLKYKFKKTDPQGRPASSPKVSGMPDEHLKIARQVAKEQDVVILFRTTNPRGVQYIKKGHPPKGKDLIEVNTSDATGKVTVSDVKGSFDVKPGKSSTWSKQYRVAMKNDYYVLHPDGFAYNKAGARLKKGGKELHFDMNAKDANGNPTHLPGQVIDPKTRKAVVGDYDLQDVIPPTDQTRNFAVVPEKSTGDVYGAGVRKVKKAFNEKLHKSGDPFNRIVHGADAQFMQFRKFRDKHFKGDAIAVLPDGTVGYLSSEKLPKFYKAIGRYRLDIGNADLQPYTDP